MLEPHDDDDDCPYCDGEGVIVQDCIEDSCCCVDPELEHGVMECWHCATTGEVGRGN